MTNIISTSTLWFDCSTISIYKGNSNITMPNATLSLSQTGDITFFRVILFEDSTSCKTTSGKTGLPMKFLGIVDWWFKMILSSAACNVVTMNPRIYISMRSRTRRPILLLQIDQFTTTTILTYQHW